MESDFKPAARPAESLQASFKRQPVTIPKQQTEISPNGAREIDESVVEDSHGQFSPPEHLELPEAPDKKPGRGWRQNWRQKLKLSWPPGKKEYIVLVSAIILIGAIVGAIILTGGHSKPVAIKVPPKKPPAPISTTVASTLSGLQVAPAVNQLPVTAVMIENSTEARPQSGLGQASVVFEALAEGGITRFMALYQDTSPSNVGPIRSVRPYYEQWALGFDAAIAHVGGSPDALNDISAWSIRDLDEFYNGGSYHRITTREAPHNVYTGIATLNQLETSKGYTSSTYTGFVRASKEAPVKTPTAATINFNLSSSAYNVTYSYDAATNSYNRSEGGAPMIDANTNQQISPKVVIGMVVPLSQGALDASGAYYSVYGVIGSGPVYVFQNGTVTTGTWTKSANTSQITFAGNSGQPIKLNPGQTWLTALAAASEVSYTP